MGAIFAAQVVSWVCNILILILVVRSVLSWIVYSGNQYNRTLHRIYDVLGAITEPIVAPVRRLIARFVRTGPVDFAPMAAFFLIIIIRRILVAILIALA
jgi:YggT family protein